MKMVVNFVQDFVDGVGRRESVFEAKLVVWDYAFAVGVTTDYVIYNRLKDLTYGGGENYWTVA